MPKFGPSQPLLQKIMTVAFTLLILLICFRVTLSIERSAWKVVKVGQVEIGLEKIETSLGQGFIIGTLGGFRTILADFAWLQLYNVWVQKKRAELSALIRLVTTLDPRPEFFWINASRMLAYDVSAWRIKDEGGYFLLPKARQEAINSEQSEQAFALLHRALEFHPDSPYLHLEIGQIYMNCLKDDGRAAEWFLKASELPNAPYFAARIYAELLRCQGRLREAYNYLKQHFFKLEEAPFPQREIVLDRIRYYEELLDLSPSLLFLPDFGKANIVNAQE